jgi:glutamate/aspartate transport system substrate-binding protein
MKRSAAATWRLAVRAQQGEHSAHRRAQTRGGAVMRSAISALAGFALAGNVAFAQPTNGRLKIIHETATLRVAYRIDSRPFSYVDAQGRPVGYTTELCERIARSLEAQLNVALTIKWVVVDERTRFDAIVNDTADMEADRRQLRCRA